MSRTRASARFPRKRAARDHGCGSVSRGGRKEYDTLSHVRTSPSHLRTRCRAFQYTENRNIANRPPGVPLPENSCRRRHRRRRRRSLLSLFPPIPPPRGAERPSAAACRRDPRISAASRPNEETALGSSRDPGIASEKRGPAELARSEQCRLGKPSTQVLYIGALPGARQSTALVHVFAGTQHCRKIQLYRAELIRKHARFSATHAEETRFDCRLPTTVSRPRRSVVWNHERVWSERCTRRSVLVSREIFERKREKVGRIGALSTTETSNSLRDSRR